MKFNEKLKKFRKEKGYSQEELAEQLGVSRQAVSKWENDQGFPETEKLIQISSMFNVSIDTLLKDGDEIAGTEEVDSGYYASQEMINGYLAYKNKSAKTIALGVLILILSQISNFLFEEPISMILLFSGVATGVAVLVYNTFRVNRYQELETNPLIFDNKVLEEFKLQYNNDSKRYGFLVVTGIVVLIMASLSAVLLSNLEDVYGDKVFALFLPLVAVGVYLLIVSGSAIEARKVIVNNKKYIEEKKRENKYGWIWGLATMIFLLIGFTTGLWHPAWIVFPITAFIFAGVSQIKK